MINQHRATKQEILDGVYASAENCCSLNEDGWALCDEPVNWELKDGKLIGSCDDGHDQNPADFVNHLPMYMATDGKKAPLPEIFDPLWK